MLRIDLLGTHFITNTSAKPIELVSCRMWRPFGDETEQISFWGVSIVVGRVLEGRLVNAGSSSSSRTGRTQPPKQLRQGPGPVRPGRKRVRRFESRGATYVPIHHGAPAQRAAYIIRDGGIKVLLTNSSLVTALMDISPKGSPIDTAVLVDYDLPKGRSQQE